MDQIHHEAETLYHALRKQEEQEQKNLHEKRQQRRSALMAQDANNTEEQLSMMHMDCLEEVVDEILETLNSNIRAEIAHQITFRHPVRQRVSYKEEQIFCRFTKKEGTTASNLYNYDDRLRSFKIHIASTDRS